MPSKIVLLKALPLTANGKLDAAALPRPAEREADDEPIASAPKPRDVDPEPDARAPVDQWERRLKGLWEQLLEVEDIGCEDNFFEVGGHSLLAIRLIDAIDKRFGRSLSIAAFFHAPTIRDQALLLRQQQAISTCVIAVRARGERPPLFVVPGYGGAVSPFHALAKALGTDQPLYLIDLNSVGCDPPQAVTIESVAAQVVESMRRVQPRGPYHIAGYSLGGRIAYEIAQQLSRDGEHVGLLAMLDCGAPGYPPVQSFVSRTFLHIRHALQLAPGESRAYFAARVRQLKKYIKPERVYPPVFAQGVAERSMQAARAIEARAQVLYDAWLTVRPPRLPGRAQHRACHREIVEIGRHGQRSLSGLGPARRQPHPGCAYRLRSHGIARTAEPAGACETAPRVARPGGRAISPPRGSADGVTLALAKAPESARAPACELQVWRVRVDHGPAVLEGSLRILDDHERARATRFRHAADRTRYVLGRASLRRLLAMRLGLSNERLVFGANAFGKPVLTTPGADLHFNSSHSGEWILHAFDALAPVGIDVETVRPDFAGLDDFAAALSPEESLRISRLPKRARPLALAQTWVRKEAYVKAIGEGVSRSPAHICICADAAGTPRLAYDRNAPCTPLPWSFADVAVDANHVACLVYSGHDQAAARAVVIRDLEPHHLIA